MSEVLTRRLMLRVSEFSGRRYDREFSNGLDELLQFPEFSASEDLTDWRTFVDQELRTVWASLDRHTRIAVYLTALRASHEAKKLLTPTPPDVPKPVGRR